MRRFEIIEHEDGSFALNDDGFCYHTYPTRDEAIEGAREIVRDAEAAYQDKLGQAEVARDEAQEAWEAFNALIHDVKLAYVGPAFYGVKKHGTKDGETTLCGKSVKTVDSTYGFADVADRFACGTCRRIAG